MADRELRLRIGASIDASFSTVLASVVEQVKRARKQIRTDVASSLRVQVAAEKAAANETAVLEKKKAKTVKEVADDMTRSVEKSARERVRREKEAMREVERELRAHSRERQRIDRENARIFRQAQKDEAKAKASSGRDLSRRDAMYMRAGGAALGGAARLAGSMMHGMGVEAGMQNQLTNSVERERLAVSISNQAYVPSGGPAGSEKRVDSSLIMSSAHKAASATGMETNDLLQGIEKYVSHTGDLQTILANMEDMAKMAKANGSSFNDMAIAASELANEMGDIPNKGKAVFDTMRALAGQGQVTAIEIRDQAKSAAMIAAQANFYKIDPRHKETLENAGVKDEVGQRIAVLGGLAQMARGKGGRVTARMAMQSSMAFMRDLANPTEIKRFEGHGLDVYTDKSKSMLRDPVQMLMEAFKKAQSDGHDGGLNRNVLNNIFTNQQSRAVTNAFAQTYNEEYKKAAAEGVIDSTKRHQRAMDKTVESFEKLLGTTQSVNQINESFSKALNTTESQAKIMNNEIGKATDELAKAFLPALKAMTPAIVFAIGAISKFAEKMLGTTQEKDDTKRTELGLRGVNTLSTLKSGLRQGTLTQEEILEAQERKKEIEAELEARRKKITEDKGQRFISIKGKWNEAMRTESEADASDAFLNEAAQQEGSAGAAAQRVIQDRRAMASLEDTLQQIVAGLATARSRESEGTFKVTADKPIEVHIVQDSSAKPGAEPVTKGVANPNSTHE